MEGFNPAEQRLSLTTMVNLPAERQKVSSIVTSSETKEETSPADGDFMAISGMWKVLYDKAPPSK